MPQSGFTLLVRESGSCDRLALGDPMQQPPPQRLLTGAGKNGVCKPLQDGRGATGAFQKACTLSYG